MNSVTAVKACGDPLSGIESKEIYEIDAPAVKNKRVYLLIKRAFDIMASVAAGLVFMIPMAIIAVIIRLDSTGPVLYRQERLGLNGKPFNMVKFRSMGINAEENGPQWADKDDDRCTKVGRVLRKFRLDELPQVWSILKGDMILQNPDSGDGAETKAVLEISENKDYSDAMEFELDPDETELTIDNLFPDTTYYYRVTIEDVVSGDKAGAVTDTETYTGQFTTADTSRFLNIADLKNTRDTGGYETADGRVTKYGMIIRGTETDGLLESSYFLKDRETAASFGFRYDFDLREDWTLTGNYQSMLGKNVSHKFYTAPSYGDVFNEAYHPALKEIFHDLSNPRNYPMYMHCTYGADRTGTIFFLLQGILGVPEEKMVEEYALTGFFREVNNSNRINSIFGGLEGTEGATINEKIVNYLTGTVGVPMRDIENIRSILLEKQ